jgi:DNA-binding transcriptional LysR family regulator
VAAPPAAAAPRPARPPRTALALTPTWPRAARRRTRGSRASLDIPDLLAGFHRQYPAIEITLAEGSSDHLADGVRTGTYDLAFIGLGPEVPGGLALQVVADEPIVAAVAGDSELICVESATLAEIADRALISLPAGTGLRACVDAAYAAAGLDARVAFEASDPRTLARLAARGLGLAFLPASAARAHGDGLHAITISDPPMRGRLALAWRAEAPVGPAARALIAHARALLPEPTTR